MSTFATFRLAALLMASTASLADAWAQDAAPQAPPQTPRQLNAEDQARLQSRMAAGKVRRAQEAQEAEARQKEEALRREEEERLAQMERDAQAEWEASQPQPSSSGGFGEALLHGLSVFQDEMAKAQVERAQQEAFLDDVRRQAESIAWQREQELARERQRVADEQARREQARQQQAQQQQALQQRQMAQQANAVASTKSSSGQAQPAQPSQQQAQQQQLREQVVAERQRQQAQREQALASEQAAAERQRKADEDRRARDAANAERQRQEQAAQAQRLRQAEQSLLSGFRGRAATCVGGGKDVLYLQTSTPAKTGCRVTFEARCPGTPAGAGVHFSQANYIGGSCQGLGDNIRIGPMACAAEQVQLSMTGAECG